MIDITNCLSCILSKKSKKKQNILMRNVSMIAQRFFPFFCVGIEWISFSLVPRQHLSLSVIHAKPSARSSFFLLNVYLSSCSVFFFFHPSTQPSVQPSILWMGQHSGATLSPFSKNLGTTTCRRQCMVSRSPAPSGTPTNRSRDSFGWSIRT